MLCGGLIARKKADIGIIFTLIVINIMNIRMKRIFKKKWASQMVANAKHQNRIIHVLDRGTASCMDNCQRWASTPQGHGYWSEIQGRDC